jgi:uncharacterized protein
MAKLGPAALKPNKPRRPGLRLVVLQPTPFCNIDCSYCYLEGRSSTKRMSFEILELAFKRVFESSLIRDDLEVAWHGGESLTLPTEWYDEAFAIVGEADAPLSTISTPFSNKRSPVARGLGQLFCRTKAKVGLSIDGPADLHDTNWRTKRGHGTHGGAMRAVRLLQDRGLAFSVITVLTDRTLDHPDRLFELYVENGIQEVGFNVEGIEGPHVQSSLRKPDIELRYRFFLKRFLQLVWSSPEFIKVREFETHLAYCSHGKGLGTSRMSRSPS